MGAAAGAAFNWKALPPKPDGANPDAPKLTELPFNDRPAFSDSSELLTFPLEKASLRPLPVTGEAVELFQLLINPPPLAGPLSAPPDKFPSPF